MNEECVLHANCQGEALAVLLGLSPEFSARWRIRHYTNYTRETLPGSALHRASLFLYQHLEGKWGDLASEALLEKLGPQTRAVCIPNLFFQGYWPFWYHNPPTAFADFYLDKLLAAGAGKAEILQVYLRGKVERAVDFAEVLRKTLEREREKERRWDVQTTRFVEDNWKTIRLFQTVNHPDAPLLLFVADGILRHLGLPALPEEVHRTFTYDYEGFALPIHPKVAASHGLAFAGEDAKYQIFGRELSFAQYVSRYIDCHRNGHGDNFLGYLQLV